MIDFITFCDYTGTFAFAISGIRLASAKQFDWFGAYVVGVVTAVGGGTIRDILLNATPFWMEQASYLIISALALLFVIIFRKYVITGALGGMIRDILINEVPLIFRKDIYALACVFGGIIYYACLQMGIGPSLTQLIAATGIFVSRIVAVKYHISVPVLKGEE